MANMLDIVTRAFRKIGVTAKDEVLDASDSAHGIEALNAMMHAWKLRGVDTEHVTLDLSDPFPLAPEFEEGTVYLLASRISPDYEVPQSFDADDWFRAFQAAYIVIPVATIPRALLRTPSQRRYIED